MKTKLLLAVLALGLFVSGCKKEYITQEVVLTNTTILTPLTQSGWVQDNDGYWYAPLNIPELNNSTTQTDGVLVYISTNGGDTWEALPDVVGGTTIYYTYTAGSTGNLVLNIQGYDGGAVAPTSLGTLQVKIVLVASAAE